MESRLPHLALQTPPAGQPPAPRRPATDPGADGTKKGTTPRDDAATQPALGDGDTAGTGVLRQPGQPDRDVPLMSIRKDEPHVQVGPISKETGVADVLLGSVGIVAVAVIGSLILGAVLGGVLVFVKHRLGWGGPDKDDDEHITLSPR